MYIGLILLTIVLLVVIIGAMILSFLSKTEIDKYVSGTDPKGKEKAAKYAEYASILSGVGLALLLLGFGFAYFYYRSGGTFKDALRKAKAPFQYFQYATRKPIKNSGGSTPATKDVSDLEISGTLKGEINIMDDYTQIEKK